MVFPPLPSSKPGPTAPYSRSPIDDAYLSSGRPDVDVGHRGWVKLRWHGGSFFASSSSGVLALADSSAPSGRLPRPQTGLGKGVLQVLVTRGFLGSAYTGQPREGAAGRTFEAGFQDPSLAVPGAFAGLLDAFCGPRRATS